MTIVDCLRVLDCKVKTDGWAGFIAQIFHKSRLCKLRVSPSETAMMDVLREVMLHFALP